MTQGYTKAHVLAAQISAGTARTNLADAMQAAAREPYPAHTCRQLGVLWNQALQLWEDLGRMLDGGALDTPTPPAERKEST